MEFKADFILIAQFDGVQGRLFTAHLVKADLEKLHTKNWHNLCGAMEMQVPITPGAVKRGSMMNLVAEVNDFPKLPKYIIKMNGMLEQLKDDPNVEFRFD